jgi:hypothetical protein
VLAAGAILSGIQVYSEVGPIPLAIFALKSFMLGLCTGVVTISEKRKKLIGRDKWGKKVRKEIYDPTGFWFIAGFGVVVAIFSVVLITGLLAVTTLCVFLFGFFVIYSGAIDEVVKSRDFTEWFGIFVILGAILISIWLVYGDQIVMFLEGFFSRS